MFNWKLDQTYNMNVHWTNWCSMFNKNLDQTYNINLQGTKFMFNV